MPIYQLKCVACEMQFEAMASISDRQNKKIICPDCGKTEHQPIYSGFANIFIKNNKKADTCPHAHQCGGGCCKS